MAEAKTFEQLQIAFNEANLDAVYVQELALRLARTPHGRTQAAVETEYKMILGKYTETKGFISISGIHIRILSLIKCRMDKLMSEMKALTAQTVPQFDGEEEGSLR